MSLILCLETATTVCSAALFADKKLLAFRELNEGFTHAENLHLFIKAILEETATDPNQLSAIAVSKGPGSYTGLRIGVSTAKGLAYALSIPLIGLETLQIMSAAAAQANPTARLFSPMIDARRMEVYTAIYDHQLQPLTPVTALILDEHSIGNFTKHGGINFFGDGMPKAKDLLSNLKTVNFIPDIHPSARFMGGLAYLKFQSATFEDTAYFEPYYLKEFQAGKAKMGS